ncbi:NHL repeat containing protein [Turneriella parva DSM 21527]|uniref:NHL repeat containing protein n=1 Tax=Turneriella parva (strain ATCC BAA-1111 / DSM 21527 / NCTC 11395 / H) TaxID=869212 RepID=I4B942_TURPD|nr:NHL repeat containing protein [Turneriella parva DSM 21527]
MKGMKLLAGFSMCLGLMACKGDVSPAKLSGNASLRLADGSPISQSATTEYNPYVVKMPDGFLMLVFGSDRSCGGCTAGTHNILVARSLAAYNDDARLPAFSTPTVFTVGGTPLNSATAVSFVATKSSALLRIYLANAGIIQYAELTPTATPYNVAALSSIAQATLARSTLLGIDATGGKLFAKHASASQPFYFEPMQNTRGMTRISASTDATAVLHVSADTTGQSDAFLALVNGAVVSVSHGAQGAELTQLAAVFKNAKVNVKSLSVLHAAAKAGELVFLSGSEAGDTKQDLFVLEGSNAGSLWETLSSRPASGSAAYAAWTQPQLTATRVYGQNGSFTCNVINNNNSGCVSGGATPNDRSFERAFTVSVSDNGIYVADQYNNRALYFPGVSLSATRVYCQSGNFNTRIFGGTPNSQTCRGQGTYGNVPSVFADNSGVYLNDIESSRILYFAGTNIDAASGLGGRVYGQAGNYATFASSTTDQGLFNPDSTAADATGVYVADTFNNRILHYPGTSTTADRVYGQPNYTTNTAGTSATSLNGPRGLAIAPDGLYVADTGNNRIVFFPGTSTTASRVYGQPDFTSNTAGTTAGSLNSPWGIRFFAGGIYVADYNNHRVLYFAPEATVATRVWGQGGSFTANTANNGGLSASSLNFPPGLDVDQTGLYIADSLNHRVLFFPR